MQHQRDSPKGEPFEFSNGMLTLSIHHALSTLRRMSCSEDKEEETFLQVVLEPRQALWVWRQHDWRSHYFQRHFRQQWN